MKPRIFAVILSAVLATGSFAVTPDADSSTAPGSEDSVSQPAPDKGKIEILMAPVALYPDALVALILPAATHPSEVVLASRFLQSGGKEEDIDSQDWDDSVKALAHYPEVIEFMDENLAWTQDVGDTFVAYPADVMNAIQTLRARASRNGLLANTPEQQVIFDDDDTIRIVPTEPDVIYVPYYEPSYLYYTDSYVYYPSSLVWFGVGYGIGSWLSFDCDWGRHSVWVTHYTHRWDRGYDWRRRYNDGWKSHVGGNNWTCWKPAPGHRFNRPRGDFNFARTTNNYATWRNDGDRTRTRGDWHRGSPSDATFSNGRRSIDRADAPRDSSSFQRGDRRDPDRGTSDRGREWRDRRPSASLDRYTGDARSGNDGTTTVGRSLAPVHRAPDVVERRDPPAQRRDAPVRRTAPTEQRRQQPEPTVRAAPSVPPPTHGRTITSGAEIRHPQTRVAPSPPPVRVQSEPAPAVRHTEQSRSSPPPQSSQDSGTTRRNRSDN